MQSFECFRVFEYAIAAVLLSRGACASQNMSTSPFQFGEHSLGDFLQFVSAPDRVVDGSVVGVHYQCSRPCKLRVEVVVSTPKRTGVPVFRRRWTNRRHLHVPRVRLVELSFPPAMAYRPDFFLRRRLEAQDVVVRAWLEHSDGGRGSEASSYHGSPVRTSTELAMVPASERPAKRPTGCPSRMAELLWQFTRRSGYQCPHESVSVDVLKFALVSTGERFGMVRKFRPFTSRELERARIQAVEQPRTSLSVWVYLLRWCVSERCGLIHHVDGNSDFNSPLIQLTSTGDILVQMRLVSGRDEAFRCNIALPLRTWIRLDCSIQGPKVTLEVRPEATAGEMAGHIHSYEYQNTIHYNDTNGYFVIGGSKYLPGIHGFFGPIKYYRFGTNKVMNPLSPERTLVSLDEAYRDCEEVKGLTAALLQPLTDQVSDTSHDQYVSLQNRFGQNTCSQVWTWETQKKHQALFSFLKTHKEDFTTGPGNRRHSLRLRTRLFEHVVSRLSDGGAQMEALSGLTSLLQVSSCHGHQHAALLLATVHLAGLGVPVDQPQGHVYSLMGAAGDDRLALMHLGYKHTHGMDGFPKDFDMGYAYYSNVGAQTSADHGRILESRQYPVENIHLSEPEELNGLTHETSDSFRFLKFQAEKGDEESQKLLSQILMGQNGATKDVASALQWYERRALQAEDPAFMYKYSILLLDGQRVKRNVTLALQLMKKAIAMGSIEALNGLGWYHSMVLNDHRTAVRYFEQAADKGSHEAMYNLGVYRLNRDIPGILARNETAAFHHFLNASAFGHAGGSVEAACYLSTGRLEGLPQDAERAVTILKRVCEHSGFLGYVVRAALRAYVQGSRTEALVRYALAAETGLGVAQNNAAHLCEELMPGHDCQWRYHNYSTMNRQPHASGLLRMGDFHYSGRRGTPSPAVHRAISLYSRAALAGSPQGVFNLVALAEEGFVLPRNIQRQFNASTHDDQDTLVEKLLQRCVELEQKDVAPCSLVLLRTRMRKAWRRMTQDPLQLSLACATVVSFITALIVVLIQNVLEHVQENTRHRSNHSHTVEGRAGPEPVDRARTNGSGLRDDVAARDGRTSGGFRGEGVPPVGLSPPRGGRSLRQTSDWAVTVSGVCLGALGTMLLYELL